MGQGMVRLHRQIWTLYILVTLGYTLTNGAIGVFFNDSTKVVLDANGQYFACAAS